ncbi:hypothetical protein [Arthrospira sp. PCC 8006]|uniref:hypothetical protein n=1 Tax=Oscillatoriales TaxID=1150 RepID=UPI00396F2F33
MVSSPGSTLPRSVYGGHGTFSAIAFLISQEGVTFSATGGIPMVLTGRRSPSSNPVGVAQKETPLFG